MTLFSPDAKIFISHYRLALKPTFIFPLGLEANFILPFDLEPGCILPSQNFLCQVDTGSFACPLTTSDGVQSHSFHLKEHE
jgi:hypothetical protein